MDYLPLLAPDFSLILCGYLLCRFTALNKTIWSQVEILVYYFLFPVLLFTTIARTNLNIQTLTSFLEAGLLMGICGIAMADRKSTRLNSSHSSVSRMPSSA